MRKAATGKYKSIKKWLGKEAQAGLNTKPVQAALANAEKASTELASLKARMAEMSAARKAAQKSLESSLDMVKAEKRLKQKQARIQSKLSALVAPG